MTPTASWLLLSHNWKWTISTFLQASDINRQPQYAVWCGWDFFEIPLVCKGVFPNPGPNPPKERIKKNPHARADKVILGNIRYLLSEQDVTAAGLAAGLMYMFCSFTVMLAHHNRATSKNVQKPADVTLAKDKQLALRLLCSSCSWNKVFCSLLVQLPVLFQGEPNPSEAAQSRQSSGPLLHI